MDVQSTRPSECHNPARQIQSMGGRTNSEHWGWQAGRMARSAKTGGLAGRQVDKVDRVGRVGGKEILGILLNHLLL